MNAVKSLRVWGAAAMLGGLLTGAPVLAQECNEAGTDDERIACLQSRVEALEAELARARGELAAATPAEDAAPAPDPADSFGAEQLDAPAAPLAAATAAEPVEREGRRWLRAPRLPFFGRDDEDDGAPETAVAAVEPNPPSSATIEAPASSGASPSGPEAFGAEQIASVESRATARDEDVLHASIVDFQVLHRGRLVVALDNGQMWRQLDVDTRQLRLDQDERYPVEIRRSGFGGYRMKIADSDRLFSVERLR